jgi:addiction module RelE/StbE family toxin
MKYKIRINPLVITDIEEIRDYIAEDNPQAAMRIVNTIYSSIEKLGTFPEMGAPLSSRINLKTDYRYLICDNYLIFYKIEKETVSVYRVLNGSRDYLSILFKNDIP